MTTRRRRFLYADSLAADTSFTALTVSGTSFVVSEPDAATAGVVTVGYVAAPLLASKARDAIDRGHEENAEQLQTENF